MGSFSPPFASVGTGIKHIFSLQRSLTKCSLLLQQQPTKCSLYSLHLSLLLRYYIHFPFFFLTNYYFYKIYFNICNIPYTITPRNHDGATVRWSFICIYTYEWGLLLLMGCLVQSYIHTYNIPYKMCNLMSVLYSALWCCYVYPICAQSSIHYIFLSIVFLSHYPLLILYWTVFSSCIGFCLAIIFICITSQLTILSKYPWDFLWKAKSSIQLVSEFTQLRWLSDYYSS